MQQLKLCDHLPLENEYKIVQTDASQTGWGGILLAVTI